MLTIPLHPLFGKSSNLNQPRDLQPRFMGNSDDLPAKPFGSREDSGDAFEKPNKGHKASSPSGAPDQATPILPAVDISAGEGIDFPTDPEILAQWEEAGVDISLFRKIFDAVNQEVVATGQYIDSDDINELYLGVHNTIKLVNKCLNSCMQPEEEDRLIVEVVKSHIPSYETYFFRLIFTQTINECLSQLDLDEEQLELLQEALQERLADTDTLIDLERKHDEDVAMTTSFFGKYLTIQERKEKIEAVAREFFNTLLPPQQ